jgi:predicted permease
MMAPSDMPDPTARRLARIASLPLALAPREFRAGYRSELVGTFALALEEERRTRGRLAMASLWLRGLGDALRAAWRERRLGTGSGGSPSRHPFADLRGDLRHVIRSWFRSPAVPVTVIVTLVLGLGLASAVFAFADGYLFRPLPFPDADRLFFVRVPDAAIAGTPTAAEANALRDTAVGRFGFVEWGGETALNYAGDFLVDGRSVAFLVQGVSPGFAETVQLPLAAGRFFTLDDHRDGSPVLVWLSHRTWQREFGGDLGVLGRRFPVTGRRAALEIEVVGIMGPAVTAFDLNNPPPDLVAPAFEVRDPRPTWLSFPIVRLPKDLAVSAVEAEIGAALQAVAPAPAGSVRTVRLSSLYDYQVRGGRPTALVFLAGAILVLILVTVSLVHLLLTRGIAREAEVAIRAALGASRWRVARPFLSESLLLGALGIGGGLLLGAGLGAIIAAAIPPYPSVQGRNLALVAMTFDGRAVAFGTVLGVIIAVVGGLWPGWRASRRPLVPAARTAAGASGRLSPAASRTILASEVALTTVVMVGAVFMTLGIWRFLTQPLGFDLRDRFTVGFELSSPDAADGVDWGGVVRAIRAIPGVRSATVRDANFTALVEAERAPSAEPLRALAVGSDYFETWGVMLAAGRLFRSEEIEKDQPVAVVDTGFVAAVWPGRDPIGQRLRVAGQPDREVVGVVAPMRWRLSGDPPPFAYVPRPQVERRPNILVWAPGLTASDLRDRVGGPVSALVPAARPFVRAESFDDMFLRDVGEARFQQPIVLTFGLFAFAISAVGLFGVVSYLVAQRTRDFGIRIALGARASHLWRSIVRESLMPAALGLGIGLAVAAGLEHVMRASVFGWDSSGPLAMLTVALALLTVAVLAAVGPARRVLRIDPAAALRNE